MSGTVPTQFTPPNPMAVQIGIAGAPVSSGNPFPVSVSGGAGTTAVAGVTASGVTVTENPLLDGGRAQNAEPTPVANGQKVGEALDLTGKTITSPYANKENWISGTTTSTDTAAHTIIASPGGSLKNYVTSMQVFRTDAGTTLVFGTLNDSASTTVPLPPASGAALTFPCPLVWAAATAVQITMSGAVTTAYASAQGFKGS